VGSDDGPPSLPISQSDDVWLQAHGFVKTLHDMICKIWVWCSSGCGSLLRQVRRCDVVLKISADWNVSDCVRIFLRRGWCITKSIIHYTNDSTIAAKAVIGKSSTPYRATELRQCALLMRLALPVPSNAPRLVQ
jgi:hypothetical protein